MNQNAEWDAEWDGYIQYLKEWADSHSDVAFCGMAPVCFDEWLDCESGGGRPKMKAFALQSESELHGYLETRSEHDSYDEAMEAAGRLFDAGDDGDFFIVEKATGLKLRFPGHTFHKESCPECGKEVRTRDMVCTHDCRGIPFRSVCQDCYDRIMGERGFDGEEYSEADECIDSDY